MRARETPLQRSLTRSEVRRRIRLLDAIVLFSHGSVLCGAERNLIELAGRMREDGDPPIVEAAFLNYNEPDFESAVARCVAAGAKRIIVVPYFLVAGKFVAEELPSRIASARAIHPLIEFVTADIIGFHPALADAILASAAAAEPPHTWSEALRRPNEWCRENPKCPLYGRDACRVRHEVAT